MSAGARSLPALGADGQARQVIVGDPHHPSCSLVDLGGRLIGTSSACFVVERGNWPDLIRRCAQTSALALELSALGADELPSLIAHATTAGLPRALHLSVHAPAKRLPDEGDEPVVRQLEELLEVAAQITGLVVHPDVIREPRVWRRLGRAMVIENLDGRRGGYQDADDLARAFDAYPEAGLCLDLAHVASVDPTLEVGHEIMDRHGDRLRQIHLSVIGPDGHHQGLDRTSLETFRSLLERVRHVPWIIEALGPDGEIVREQTPRPAL